MHHKNNKLLFLLTLLIAACGGGGGGGGGSNTPPPSPAPTLSFSATPTSVLLNNTSTFSWSTTNATSCSASGSTQWSGSKATSGTEDVPITISGNTTFTLSCSGAGGSRNATVTIEGFRQTDGVVVDGYISGADVFIDENENFIADGAENSTTSDNDGKFTIKYANGSLVSIGGTDLDSQTLLDNLLITHKLDGFSDFKAITPVTSVDAFLESTDINAALGIDSSINVGVDDPVALKGDGGIYDYLYEKGNQLTVLAYALQNITNDLNTTTETTQDFFKSIAEEVEVEYTETQSKVDIETTDFISKVLTNVEAAKALNLNETDKSNTVTALASVIPIIQVKEDADTTTSLIRFGVSQLQEDIVSLANGSASDELIEDYTQDVINYIATTESISSDNLTPDINSIDDSVGLDEDSVIDIFILNNDSFVAGAPFSISTTLPMNGDIETTNNYITYTPDADYFGDDEFSYTLSQGDKTSSADVNITINSINDVPSIDIASTLTASENQTAITTISISDVDEDELTLTLGGTDASSLNLSAENVLSFKEAPDYETKDNYSINLSLTDGTETVEKDISILITDINDVAPVFTSSASFNAPENQLAIGTVTANDEEDDDLSFSISSEELAITPEGVLTFISAPDFETKSSYITTITVSDGINEATQDISVNVTNVNDVAPVFTSSATFSAGENQTSIGTVTATDAEGDEVTFIVSGDELAITPIGILTFVSEPDFETKDKYTATITVTDGINSATQAITINVLDVDEIPPVISINGANPITVELGSTYSDAGAIADGGEIVSSESNVDTAKVGSYTVTYSATDATGNIGTATRIVNITDTTKPVITITGDNPATAEFGLTYTDAGATASDLSGDVTVISSGSVNTNVIGSYTLTYSATDDSGNTGTATRVVIVQDTTGPQITILGDNPETVELVQFDPPGSLYKDTAGAISDGGEEIITEEVDVDNTAIGTYFVYYSATDTSGNKSTVARTVYVVDTTAPSVRLFSNGSTSDEVTIELGSTFVDSGAYATDISMSTGQGSDLAIPVTVSGSVDTSNVGIYTLTYTATDASGNEGVATKTVNVVDTTAPVFTSSATFSAAENQTKIGTVEATDLSGIVIFSISGNELEITSSGILTFINAPDYETKSIYTADVIANDGENSTTQSITVNVIDVLENDGNPPVITNLTASPSTVDVTNEAATITLTVDISDESGVVIDGFWKPSLSKSNSPSISAAASWSLISGDDKDGTYQATIIVPTTAATGDYSINSSFAYDIFDNQSIKVTDAGATNGGVTITSSREADAPIITNLTASPSVADVTTEAATITLTVDISDESGVVIDPSWKPSISKIDSPSISAAASWSLISGDDKDGTYQATIIVPTTAATGDYSINSSFAYDIFDNQSIKVTDAGATNGGVTITSSREADAPIITNLTASPSVADVTTEAATITLTVDISDESGVVIDGFWKPSLSKSNSPSISAAASWSLISGDDKDGTYQATIIVPTTAATGDYSINSSFAYDIFDNQSIKVTDAGATNGGVTVLVDYAPVFTNDSTFNVEENQTSIGSVAATDPDGNSIVYTITGSEISINSSSGLVQFINAPDYETKSTYTATVTASDGTNTSTQDITVNVTDVDENVDTGPVFTSDSTFEVAENQLVIGEVTATDPDGDSISFSTTSTEILIDSLNGNMTFVSPPNFEAKSVYTATILASDGVNESSQDITINITNVVEAPEAFDKTIIFRVLPQIQTEQNITLPADGDNLTYIIVSNPTKGTLTLDGNIATYKAFLNYTTSDTDSFTFKVSNGSEESSVATLSIDIMTDPLYKYQWHLENTGQTTFATNAGTADEDLNLNTVISSGYSGAGVTVAVIDSGLEIGHEDLADNMVAGSYDFLDSDTDPTNTIDVSGDHGTSVAGIIAATGWNGLGGRGVAPDASLVGYNLLQNGFASYQLQSWGINPPVEANVDIYNMSYGNYYPGISQTFALPDFLDAYYEDALVTATTELRSGKGALYVQSSGNEYSDYATEDCGENEFTCVEVIWDNWSTVPYILQVGALNANGQKSSYTTTGAALWVSGFGGETGANESILNNQNLQLPSGIYEPAILTTDQSSCAKGYVSTNVSTRYNEFENSTGSKAINSECNYTSTFGGTSSAAPTVAGVMALIISANPDLTWRDVKHIIASTSDQVGTDSDYTYDFQGINQYEWETNSAGYKFHNWFGFGKINAADAVDMALSMQGNNLGAFQTTGFQQEDQDELVITDAETTSATIEIIKPDNSNNFIEFVRVSIQFNHLVPKSIGLRLVSPDGTEVNIMQPMTNLGTNPANTLFDIGVSGLYGESIEGTWTLYADDYIEDAIEGSLIQWGIEIYGN